MSLYNFLYKGLFGVKDAINGTGIYRSASRLREEQFLPEPNLESLREKRLGHLLAHARLNSPYYNECLSAVEILPGESFRLKDMSTLPLLTRKHLQESGERILCQNATGHYPDASGGSTGQPVNFFHDQEYVRWARANQMLHLGWMGIEPGDRTAAFWGSDRDLAKESRYARIMSKIGRVYVLNSFSMNEELIDGFLERLNRIRPRYIFGYASSLYHVARFISSRHTLGFRPVAIKSSAEMLYEFQRHEIERAFRAPVFDFYGSREVNNVAAECEAHDGLHVFGSGRVVEIVDDSGQSLPPGEVGNVAVTDLINRAFPFVRYLNGDLGILMEGKCPCGRTYPRLEKIVGRSSDIIHVDGRQIHGEYFTHLFYGRKDVKRFQLVQETEHRFTLLIVPLGEDPEVSFFRDRILEKLGRHVDLEIRLTDHIAPTAGGKHRFTVSKLHSGSGGSSEAG